MWDPPCTINLPLKSNRLTLHYGFPSHQPNLGFGTHNALLSQQKLGLRTMYCFPRQNWAHNALLSQQKPGFGISQHKLQCGTHPAKTRDWVFGLTVQEFSRKNQGLGLTMPLLYHAKLGLGTMHYFPTKIWVWDSQRTPFPAKPRPWDSQCINFSPKTRV